MAKSIEVKSELHDWKDIREKIYPSGRKQWSLLIGNGASRAIWKNFQYPSLFEIACDPRRPGRLTERDQKLFHQLETANFEAVLSALMTSRVVNEILEEPTNVQREYYARIRDSLIQAVKEVHIPYKLVNEAVRKGVDEAISEYQNVYSTNYDLLPCWASMTNPERFKDYFWGADNGFDLENCEVRGEYATVMHYLHGGLHLCYTPSGRIYKKVGSLECGGLIDQFNMDDWSMPLFISEGEWKSKKSSILRNDYLAFCYQKFIQNQAHLVVFGHSLSDEFDKHIIQAIRQRCSGGYKGIVAVSIYPHAPEKDIAHEMTRLSRHFQGVELFFFDSTTHPLGDEKLTVRETLGW